ncbi:NAD-dependent DNA ligase LigA [Actinophytocola gossypii]|uniref:DNA ligase n=1 Tax=Actinophytocola gossypii TaxID=2812003 RepID=A0ABT2J7C3_9PSEU|nr:NAD-dependent DNA ligase LigA [Actinophytocola gossypii]MCT2583763.1 NAD-dependent DNA ligase LigA [Actinophytocola gossypii]
MTVSDPLVAAPIVDPNLAAPFGSIESYAAAVAELRAAALAYYQSADPLMDDAAYDALLARVTATETARPEWKVTGSPTETVAAGVPIGGDVPHSSPMLGLDNVFGEEALRKWAARLDRLLGRPAAGYTVEPKIDGLAIAARYVDGRLTLVATRGDGVAGENVTRIARRAAGLPERLAEPVTLEVRGEVYMTETDFAAANELRIGAGEPAFAHPRSAAAGTLRADQRAYDAPLSFLAYAVQGMPDVTHSAAMAELERLGVATTLGCPAGMTVCTTIDEALAAVERIGELRGALGFGVDGAVVKADQPADRDAAGSSSRAPRWGISYKFPVDTRTTTLLGIEVQVGRTGVITPVAVLEPVVISGVTVVSATLHNFGDLVRRNVRVGDTVFVRRAGDVIPEITGAKLDERPVDSVPFEPPEHCPRCGGGIDRSQKRWRCVQGRVCGARQTLAYFATRDAMDIEHLGDKIIDQLVAAGLVADPADLFDLDVPTLVRLERMGEVSAGKLVASIQGAKDRPLSKVLTALGMRMAGRAMCRRLAAEFGTVTALLEASVADLQRVEGVGPERAVTIAAELADYRAVIEKLIARGVNTTEPRTGPAEPGLPLRKPDGSPMRVVVTGAVPGLTNRTDANDAVERLGGKASGSVSAKTDLVVVGDGAGSKAAKAEELGIRIMPAEEFAALL